jgi:hypothetical protein
MRTSKLILNSVSEHARQKHSRDAPRATLGTCMLPRPLSRLLDHMVRLPSNGELARTRTTASGRSRSRLTKHGARDDTRHKSSDISRLISRLRARTHALPCAPSCTGLGSGSVPSLRSGSSPVPPTYARSQPNLPTARLQQPRAARRAWSLLEKIDSRMVSRPSRACSRSRPDRHPRRGGRPDRTPVELGHLGRVVAAGAIPDTV